VERVGVSVGLGPERSVTRGYAWEPWDAPTWHERPKAGIELFAEAVRDITP
jgi:hypothetical protein